MTFKLQNKTKQKQKHLIFLIDLRNYNGFGFKSVYKCICRSKSRIPKPLYTLLGFLVPSVFVAGLILLVCFISIFIYLILTLFLLLTLLHVP